MVKKRLTNERGDGRRWWFAAVALKLVLLFGSFQIPPLQETGLTLLPLSQWGFGLDTDTAIWSDRYRDACVDGTEHYRWGFFQKRVECGPG